MQVRDTPVLVDPDTHPSWLIVGAGGSGIFYGPSQSNTPNSSDPGTTVTLTAPTWVVSQGGRDGHAADIVLVDQPPSPGSAGTGSATIVAGGNLGATSSLALSATQEKWLTGTLTANHVLTLSGLAAGARAKLLLTQDATGGRTLSITDGTTTQLVGVDPDASSFTEVVIETDGTDLFLTVPGGASGVPADAALTGAPTAPTPPAGNSSTRIATTAFVAAAALSTVPAADGGDPTSTYGAADLIDGGTP